MNMKFILIKTEKGLATITLNRPEKHNALNGLMVTELLQALANLATDDTARALMIKGNGASFCAGGDIAWMQKIATGSEDENYADAQLLADLLYQLYCFSKPTIVLAHGATLGGGLGLIAAADIAIASQSARFGFSEVKIGITPSMISPYVLAAIGERAAYYYFLTGENFTAAEAYRIGLIQKLTEDTQLEERGMALAATLLRNSPKALHAAKGLIRHVVREQIDEKLSQKTAEHLAEMRATPEAQEGLQAFLEKRDPNWVS